MENITNLVKVQSKLIKKMATFINNERHELIVKKFTTKLKKFEQKKLDKMNEIIREVYPRVTKADKEKLKKLLK